MWKKAREIDNRYKVSSTELMNGILPPLFSKYFNINKNEVSYTRGEDNGVIGIELSIYLPNEIDETEKEVKIKRYLPLHCRKIVIITNTQTMGNGKYKGLHRYLISIYYNGVTEYPTMEYISKITADIEQIITDE